MASQRHNKHCTFKKTQVCICANLEAALAEQEKKYQDKLAEDRMTRHRAAQESYRDQIIRAFTNLIDDNFQIEEVHECKCSRYDYW